MIISTGVPLLLKVPLHVMPIQLCFVYELKEDCIFLLSSIGTSLLSFTKHACNLAACSDNFSGSQYGKLILIQKAV